MKLHSQDNKAYQTVTGYDAHGYGLGWFEQKKDGSFVRHDATAGLDVVRYAAEYRELFA